MSRVHTYNTRLEWSGSTGVGYDDYDRTHTVSAGRVEVGLELSSDPAFLGDPRMLNPEQLLLAAASSCQLLSFLAAAARSRIDVLEYSDDAEGTMDESERPPWVQRIVLRPRIVVGPGTDEERVRRLVQLGHEHCFIANSLKSEIVIEAEIEVRS
ncbi:MAG TPA: OsmC family protein [Thermoleophilaceae bacterium]